MLFVSIIVGSVIGFIIFRAFTAKTPEKRQEWYQAGAIFMAAILIVIGVAKGIDFIAKSIPTSTTTVKTPTTTETPTTKPRPTKDPDQRPIASVGGGAVNPDNSEDPHIPIREDLLPASTPIVQPARDNSSYDTVEHSIDDEINTSDFDPDSI